ncbi:MAG: HAMP domain-containing histidine kinase [Cyclobacteriaceae bacterium]|nr:GHKL domain-containing protein [Cyclobacteriaceae bacterium]MCB0499522.1 GHKL domain-containing protein [Cyclobacteriaceae bacterium]MCB9238102.1 GHKL domain-containing protein [Flammeovirgaceae bacterium]MCO5272506.1 HAMP domain-containing histidine kinase [Cyclobacteriaceae bacterium]MCW5901574.1 GHKL domain-containing protein [Cyclobacteriaceae bacterium]
MSRNSLRIVIVLAAISIIGIAVTQIYWVGRALDIRENQFNRDVNTALSNVAARVSEINKAPAPATNPVNQLSTNYFVVAVNDVVDAGLLEFLLVSEFEKKNIRADFEYGVYDCSDKCMVYGKFVSSKPDRKLANMTDLPTWDEEGYYFGVQFPFLQANLLSQMGIWGFSSAVLLVVVLFFIYTLLAILKQKRLSEVQKDFINNMTHEFKTPIATIAISSEVLKSPGISSEPDRLLKYATVIKNESHRLKQQVDRVLQMAQLDEKKIDLSLGPIDGHEWLTGIAQNCSLAMKVREGGIGLQLNAVQCRIKGDKLHLTNVVNNLIDNAVKYNNDPVPRIHIRTYNKKGRFCLEVEDNGIGIAPENHDRVFERFYRVPTGNVHNVKGFGLGLNYVKLIVEAHKGSISLDSTPGKGTTFKISLPLYER